MNGEREGVDLAIWRERAEFWTTRDPSTIGHLYDEAAVKFAGEVLYLLDRLKAAEAAVARVRALADECATAIEPDGSPSIVPVRWVAAYLRAALDPAAAAGEGGGS